MKVLVNYLCTSHLKPPTPHTHAFGLYNWVPRGGSFTQYFCPGVWGKNKQNKQKQKQKMNIDKPKNYSE